MSDQHATTHLTDGPRDPEHDPAAVLALEPEYVERLTSRILATSGESKEVTSPISGAPLAHIPQSSEADVVEAFARARTAQEQWARTPFAVRKAMLLKLHDLVLERQAEILDLIVLESGKARKHAFDEPVHIALTARYYGRTLDKHLAAERKPGVFPLLTRIDLNHLPKGVVGIISPWNYPFTMALCDGLAAIAAGNAVVAKPDAQTMLSALLGAELLEEAGLPRDLWQVVAGPGSVVGTSIIAKADYICFTGSTATGKRVAAGCAERLIGCSLELGGKNPMLVLADADIERAAEGAVRAVYSNTGQLCVSIERMYVADAIYDRFMERFTARVEAMTLGAGLDWEIDMGSLISQDQLDTAVRHVEDAVAHGAHVRTGGRARPELAPFYFEPTILEGVTPAAECFAHETFGPIVSVYRFTDEADAIARANEGEYGLNASVWTRDSSRGRRVAAQIKAGTVNVNEGFAASFGSLEAPMGGVRESGMGRRQGREGILRYTETQTVATERLMNITPQFGMSDETWAKVLTVSLKALKKTGRA
ncbi:succinic semialdehyde dehydrogenase [Nocardioides sp. Kera G14]|uniref:succinic semialdehyde dehydrogenase n=1 Tax=Nocardioides sp. Kera G14 TaxID=2884264 RepID=UPI001D122A85|nr:succinic semialdehyde dehydrogenase [Nocardioides sp. Kera G14]UDY24340.1 succinate-semialdehyde dehydrogenase (NADP(+)) [Nocardioides sp. Kera G14]